MVYNGIDSIEEYAHLFENKRLGLITSVSGVNHQLVSSIQILHNKYGLVALFSPEHGVRGDRAAGELVESYRDKCTGLPVYSLYRKDSKRMTKEMLDLVDAVIYDIQDIGTRFYTFISTLYYALYDCAKYNKELIILDRINPLGGEKVEGNVLKEDYRSFVGTYPLCIRHGLTVGEFANMVNKERKVGCQLTVVPCKGWKRQMLFPETGLHWLMPSLGIPHFETALLYPGICLVEGTNLSEGRGTSCPFEIVGAPYIEADRLTDEMNKKNLRGVIFTPIYFTPTISKYKGVPCEGIHIHVIDSKNFESVTIGIELLFTIKEMYPAQFEFLQPKEKNGKAFISLLAGSDVFSNESYSKEQILEEFLVESQDFAERKRQYHLYE